MHTGITGMGDLPQPQSQSLKPQSLQLSTAVHRGLPQARLPAMALSCATWAPLAFPATSLGGHMHAHAHTLSCAGLLDHREVRLPQHPSWADLGCIKESPTISTQAKGRGRSRCPGLFLTALSSCHTDASQKHTDLWTQPPNHNQLQGV